MKRLGVLFFFLILGLCSTAGPALAQIPLQPACAGPRTCNLSEHLRGEGTFQVAGTEATFGNPGDIATAINTATTVPPVKVDGTFSGSLDFGNPTQCQFDANGFPLFPAQTPVTGSLVLHGVQGDLNIVLTNGGTICNSFVPPSAPCGSSCYLDGPFTVAGGTGDFGRRNGGFGEATGGGAISLGTMNGNGPNGQGPFVQPFIFLEVDGVVKFPPGVPCSVFTTCIVTIGVRSTAIITTKLLKAAPVGILVERIVGRRHVRIGRVPFGRHDKGRLRIHWDLRVNGHKLTKGRYLITLRALDAHKHVIAATRPVTITIR